MIFMVGMTDAHKCCFLLVIHFHTICNQSNLRLENSANDLQYTLYHIYPNVSMYCTASVTQYAVVYSDMVLYTEGLCS